ncbi:MAG: TonB-dependent receptor [Melioribacteraceae bacterium]
MTRILFFLLFTSLIIAQNKDSVKTYYFDDIVIKSGLVIEPKTVTEINLESIQKSDAASILELGKYIPSIKTQTNSRGESLFFIRGAGERQVSLLFDGVQLNIPWDNRIDLGLVPTEALSEIYITRGIPSVIYGANNIAGVINIESQNPLSPGSTNRINLQAGDNNYQRLSGMYSNRIDNFGYLVSVSYKKSDGYSLPGSFSAVENPGKRRLNSQSNSFSSFGRFGYKLNDNSNINFSLSYITAEKGVPSEINVSKPRYWKYPEWKKLTGNLFGNYNFNNASASSIIYSLSVSSFNMLIDQYKDKSFSTIDEVEINKDRIISGRVIYKQSLSENSLLKASFNGFTTEHKESFLSSGYTDFIYTQNLLSAGLELEQIISDFILIGGASYDYYSTPKTGDKPSDKSVDDFSLNLSAIYNLDSKLNAAISIGRKTRFPTLREKFSGALGKFVSNPSLKAESAISSELSLDYKHQYGKAGLNLFLTYMDNGIVRESLSGGMFKRINEDKMRIFGMEIFGDHQLTSQINFGYSFSILNSYAKNAAGEYSDTLEYKPEFLSALNLSYKPINQLELLIEGNYTGNEFGFQGGNTYIQKLPDYFILNARVAYDFYFASKYNLELFLRVNNIFDKLYYTQWGLPDAGREFRIGLSLNAN